MFSRSKKTLFYEVRIKLRSNFKQNNFKSQEGFSIISENYSPTFIRLPLSMTNIINVKKNNNNLNIKIN